MEKTDEQILIQEQNASDRMVRLNALRQWQQRYGSEYDNRGSRDVNCHIHTFYSFSPYSPTQAACRAKKEGLATAGIMDHDTIAGAREFIEAGLILDLPTTIGAECRISFADTPLAGRRINNPDQDTIAYVAMHGVPHHQIDALMDWFSPIRTAREKRNREMTKRLNALLEPADIHLDYEKDILPLSMAHEGGQVTERHLLFAVSLRLIDQFGYGPELIAFLEQILSIKVSSKNRALLMDPGNPYLPYDLLGVLKSDLVEKCYIDATEDECPPVAEAVRFADDHGIILAYAYLGDVTDSVTGDKKPQTFEDEYLDELMAVIKRLGFHAITYMPSRNTRAQLLRVRKLCEQHGLFEISGEDINQPRQKFVCEVMRDPLFQNLYDAAWALIGHELLATQDIQNGLFSRTSCMAEPDLNRRVEHYRNWALAHYGRS